MHKHDVVLFIRSRRVTWMAGNRVYDMVLDPAIQVDAPAESVMNALHAIPGASHEAPPQPTEEPLPDPVSAEQFQSFCRKNKRHLETISIYFLKPSKEPIDKAELSQENARNTDEPFPHLGTPLPWMRRESESKQVPTTPEQRQRLQDILHRRRKVFQMPPDAAANCEIEHEIHILPGFPPQNRAPYRLNPKTYAEMERKIQQYLDKGWISPSNSPWGAPVLFALKKNGDLRWCTDF